MTVLIKPNVMSTVTAVLGRQECFAGTNCYCGNANATSFAFAPAPVAVTTNC